MKHSHFKRALALLLMLAMVLPAMPVLPAGAAEKQVERVAFADTFDYGAFAYKTLYDDGIWQEENTTGGGNVNREQPLVEDGVMKLNVGMSGMFDWLNIPGFSFDATKTYTMQFDATVTSFGDDTPSLRRELYVAPGGYYNQVELRSDNGSKCIRTGGNYTGTKDVEYLLNTKYTVILVWEPASQKITSTLKNGETVVSTGYRTSTDYGNANKHCAHWVLRCEDGAVEIDNFSWTDGTNTYTEDFTYPPEDQCMATAGYWQTETTPLFTNSTAPELVDGVVKMDTLDSIQFNWTKLVEHDVEKAFVFEFDFKVTDSGNGYIWNGTSACTRALYVAPAGYYNQIEIINATPQIRVGDTYVAYDENVYLNKDLHAKMVLEGTTITSTIYDASGNALVTGSRTSSNFADMTVRDGGMQYVALRCEDGAVELDNFSLTVIESKEIVAQVGDETYTSVQEAVDAANGAVVKLTANSTEDITVSSNLYMDLAGHNLGSVTVTEGATLYGMDSATDNYDCTNGYGKIGAITGNYAPYHKTTADGPVGKILRYLAIVEEDGISFHRFYIGMQSVSLWPGVTGFGYKAIFGGDEKVQAALHETEAFGYKLWIEKDHVVTAYKGRTEFVSGNTLSLRLKNFDVENYGTTSVNATVLIKLANGKVIESEIYAYSMKEMVEAVNESFDGLEDAQKQAIAEMVSNYPIMQTWKVANILGTVTQ